MLLIIFLLHEHFVHLKNFTKCTPFQMFENWSELPKWNNYPATTNADFNFAPGSVIIYSSNTNCAIPPPRFEPMKRRHQKNDPTKPTRGGKNSSPSISRNTSPRTDSNRQRRDDEDNYYRGAYGPSKLPDHYYVNRRQETRRSPPFETRRSHGNGYSNRGPPISRSYRGDDYTSRHYDDNNYERDRRRLPLNQHRQTRRKSRYGERQNDRERERSKSPNYSPERPRYPRQNRKSERSKKERQGIVPRDWIVVTTLIYKKLVVL